MKSTSISFPFAFLPVIIIFLKDRKNFLPLSLIKKFTKKQLNQQFDRICLGAITFEKSIFESFTFKFFSKIFSTSSESSSKSLHSYPSSFFIFTFISPILQENKSASGVKDFNESNALLIEGLYDLIGELYDLIVVIISFF